MGRKFGQKWAKMGQKMTKNSSTNNGQKWSEMVRNGQKWSEMTKTTLSDQKTIKKRSKHDPKVIKK